MNFEWIESFSVGVPEMDAEHQRLFSLIDILRESVGSGNEAKTVADALNQLEEYSKTHFASEEKMLEEKGYPGLEKQKKEHQRFIDVMEGFKAKRAKGDEPAAIEIGSFLYNWMKGHIGDEDKKYGMFLSPPA